MGLKKSIKGFSLIEVVIVVAIIAILAAIGIPRMTRGSKGAGYTSLSASLASIRNSIDLFAAEHQGTLPTASSINDQLTQYTNIDGATSTTKTATHVYGPYLRSIPPLPVGARKSNNKIAAADANDVGWIYTASTGVLKANTTDSEVDDTGKKFNEY